MADYFYRFVVALGIGIFIGFQRESAYDEPEGKLFAGVRTFALISLAGYVAALAADQLSSALPFVGVLLVFGALLALSYYGDVLAGKPGMTTEMATVITFTIGAACYWDLILLAAALGVAVTALLSLKPQFHTLAHAITRDDIYATLKFAVISIIVLPILPNRNFGPPPFDVLNPYKIWLMVVFISGISFLGYVMIKIIGTQRGIGLTGLLGGLASSTAVTLSFSQRSRTDPELARPFSLAIIVAWTVMFVRVLAIVFTLNRELGNRLWLPMGAPLAAGLLYCGYLYIRQRAYAKEDLAFANPFELGPALKFGALYALVLLISTAARVFFGNTGIYVSSFVSGLVDVDAIVLSMVDLARAPTNLDLTVATRAVTIAALSSTLFKGVFALLSGSSALRRALWPGMVLMLVVGVAVIFVL
ncbi:MAG TPA: MgtC/SapB family protein [Anaerolineae bacterium]|nr:MgtC/SapB family protein [Anaerolineae bacterium]HQK15641.1 MgtC/SapB family protein [Anaerolineae bacterium]